MVKLTAAARKALPKSDFGLPSIKGRGGKNKAGKGAYPMPDKAHARAAKSYASKEEAAGKLSHSAEKKVDAKADKVLGKKAGAQKKPSATPNRSRAADFDDASLKGYAHTDYRHTSADH